MSPQVEGGEVLFSLSRRPEAHRPAPPPGGGAPDCRRKLLLVSLVINGASPQFGLSSYLCCQLSAQALLHMATRWGPALLTALLITVVNGKLVPFTAHGQDPLGVLTVDIEPYPGEISFR